MRNFCLPNRRRIAADRGVFRRQNQINRRPDFETLERRCLLVAEAETFSFSQAFEVAGLLGAPSAVINWGDGTQSAATVTGGTNTGNVRIKFDYSLDTTGFAADANRRSLLNVAAELVTSRLRDNLTAIQPSGTNTWAASVLHPVTNSVVNFNNLSISANEILVYVGARELGGDQLGSGGPGGVSAGGSSDWLKTVFGRGQAGALTTPATDFGPWGGTLAFDISTNWYFGLDPAGLQAGQRDFVTVAAHELTHLLGFGTVSSWSNLVSGNSFTGPKARAAYDVGGNVPLSPDRGHWLETITDAGRKTLMGPVIDSGVRDTLTGLDFAALDDIGWDVVDLKATVNAQHVYPDNGIYPIVVSYRGSTVGQFTSAATASITNTTPTLTVVGNQSAIRNQVFAITNIGSISDPGFANSAASPPTAETFSYTINWGDGTAPDSGNATIDRTGSATATTLASFDGSHTFASAGTFTVTVAVRDDDGGTVQKTFQVAVAVPPQLSLELNRTSIAENASVGAATLTIRRSSPASSSATTINISSSDTTEATVPASVVIPAGVLSVTVPVTAVDDAMRDGTQQVTLTASGSGLLSGAATLSVTDFEQLTISFTTPTVLENALAGSFFMIVTRPDNGEAVTLSISGNVPAEITLPTSATINSGSREVRISLEPINDSDPERALSLVYRVTGSGYVAGERNLILIDDEPPLFQNAKDRFDVDGLGGLAALDALRIINSISRRKQNLDLDPEKELPNGLFVDVNGDYRVTALDALQVINEIARRRRRATISTESQLEVTNAAPPVAKRLTIDAESSVDAAITQLF